MDEEIDLNAIKDALRRRQPDRLAELDTRFPWLEVSAGPTRTLGHKGGAQSNATTSRDLVGLARIAAEEAAKDLRDTLGFLQKRARMISRLRLAAGAATVIASASMIALVLGNDRGTLLAAVISLGGSLIGLFLGYVEDFSGGEGSVRQFLDTLANEQRRLALATSELRLSEVVDAEKHALVALKEINGVFAEVQFVRAKLGLAI